ncbi:P-loop containing nucleoside triphosphate hydrolase protein [Aspergillus granulosus]|uniref:P-loop containing nucleoside triphosphate hydrolase protein n=1 Tax=Aspergillus granulosus TaxID=176169 RepID=A0ABR4GRE7_9EURO
MTSLTHNDYTIAWICALPLEMAAARVMLNKTHSPLPKPSADPNAYKVGELNGHYIVIACLPAGVYGTVSAATVVSCMRLMFPRLQYGLMVGIGGGPVGKYSGAFLTYIMREALEQNPEITERFAPPEQYMDYTCEKCDNKQLIKRQLRATRTPYVIKDSETRDSGLMDELSTLVIWGICDYCDFYKQKQWQGYAALTAAAYAKLLLLVMPRNILRHWVVLLEKNPRFIGRQDEILKLEELLAVQDGPRRVAITGLGGVGKTQLALEVAHCIRNQDKECSVFWVPCTSYAVIEQTFLNIAQVLGLCEVKPAEAKEQVKLYLSSERAGKWLLILDNADDAEMWFTSEQGRILFTTCNGELAVELILSNIIYIPDVDKKTAYDILDSLLAYLPLAITQVSAYINKKRLGRYSDIQNLVITTCLRNIPLLLLPLQSTKKQKLDALGLLNAYLFTHSQDTEISMHRLNGLFSLWIQRVADQLGKLFPDNSYDKRGLWREYLPHALVLVHENDFIPQLEQYLELVERILDCLASDGRYYEAEVLYHKKLFMQVMETRKTVLGAEHPDTLTSMLEVQAMETRKIVLGAEHPDTLTSMHNLAHTYDSMGKHTEASELMTQCATLRARNIGPTHPDTLSSSDALTKWQKIDYYESPRPDKGRRREAFKRVLGFK